MVQERCIRLLAWLLQAQQCVNMSACIDNENFTCYGLHLIIHIYFMQNSKDIKIHINGSIPKFNLSLELVRMYLFIVDSLSFQTSGPHMY